MLERLLGQSQSCDCGKTHHVGTKRAVIDRNAIGCVGDVARSLGWRGLVLVVADERTFAVAGEQTETALTTGGFTCARFIFGGEPVAGPESVRAVQDVIGDAAALVAVGSGTIGDIVKSAADAAGRPYLAVGTALSMNGYTSAISALLDGGIKTTVPVRPAEAVVIDLDVCAAAPQEMTLAGLGDMLSKPFSESDWRLSALVDGGYHCDVPGQILTEAFDRMLTDAAAIGRSEPEALRSLAEATLLSGISMAMAGVSSPASGGEHLISHYWDMMCYGKGAHPFAFHGTQVGVACCLIEEVHYRIQDLDADAIDIDACVDAWPATKELLDARVRTRHPNLPASVVDGIVEQARKKWRPPDEQAARLERIQASLGRIQEKTGEALLPRGAVLKALRDATAPTEAAAIDESLSNDVDDWHIVRDIRARYTVWDLAAEVGVIGRYQNV
jgi:glycerol-1-phosphate dehydrogenase [NAD(P)+]